LALIKLKKLELLVKENLSILGANLYDGNGEVEPIRVDCGSDLLVALLQKLSNDHYSIRDSSVYKAIEIKKIQPYSSDSLKCLGCTWIY
jgi:hypothetical protein